jgi:hypothetical protein
MNCFADQLAYEATLPPPQGCLPVNVAEAPESIILNSKMNGEPWPYNSKTGLPHAGIWTFDYVHKAKPPAGAAAMDEAEFLKFIGFDFVELSGVRNDSDSDSASDDIEDKHTNTDHNSLPTHSSTPHLPSTTDWQHLPSPTDWQLVPPLSTPALKNDLHERARDVCSKYWFTLRQAMMLVKRLGSLHLQVDVIVSFWPRLIEWHGFDQVR